MDLQELKIRLEEVEQELRRNRFGLERYEAQCRRWQKELDDLDGGGFFSFLANTEAKKREALQMLGECKRDLETATCTISSLEKEENVIKGDIATASSMSDAKVPDTKVPDVTVPDTKVPDVTVPDVTVPDTSEFIGLLDEGIQNEAIALLEKIEKVVDVANHSILEGFRQVANARIDGLSNRRPGRGSSRLVSKPRSDSSGANIQMALDCLGEHVERLFQLLNPAFARLIDSCGSNNVEALEIFRAKLLDLSKLGRGINRADSSASTELSGSIDFAVEERTNYILTSLLQIAIILPFIKEIVGRWSELPTV
jgi:hypothetical protein